jgi:SAM-dependent methyltransferase
MSAPSLYEFGSSEEVVRKIQQPLVRFFAGAAPVLDIGCGRGVFLELLRSAGIQALGLDSSSEALDFCREKGLNFCREDARSFLAGRENEFGGVFCSHVIEHLDYEQATCLVRSCYRALKAGGTLVMVTPNPEDLSIISEIFWLDPTHVRPYPLKLLKSMLRSAGFQVMHEKQFLGSWRLIGRRNLPAYFFRRMLLGRYFGRPNTLVVANKPREGR